MINIKEIVSGATSIAISGHERPDGDCIGSTLGLYNYLRKIMPADTKIVVYLDKLGPRYSYLAGFENVDSEYEQCEPYDVFFSLDCSTPDRLGRAQDYLASAGKSVCIDHHVSNLGFCDERFIDGDASSACELVFRLVPDDELDENIAICLYSGIISDTGVLSFSCTSPETLRAAARLIEFGFDFSDIIQKSYYEKTYVQNMLLGLTLVDSVRFYDDKAIYGVVSDARMKEYDATPKDLDGIVNQLLATKGVHFAVFMYESGDHQYKVSMRSDGAVDVSKIAVAFEGGGHERAAGCTIMGTPEEVIGKLSEHLKNYL